MSSSSYHLPLHRQQEQKQQQSEGGAIPNHIRRQPPPNQHYNHPHSTTSNSSSHNNNNNSYEEQLRRQDGLGSSNISRLSQNSSNNHRLYSTNNRTLVIMEDDSYSDNPGGGSSYDVCAGSSSSSNDFSFRVRSTGVHPAVPRASATSMSRNFFLTPPERLQVDQSVNLMDVEKGRYDYFETDKPAPRYSTTTTTTTTRQQRDGWLSRSWLWWPSPSPPNDLNQTKTSTTVNATTTTNTDVFVDEEVGITKERRTSSKKNSTNKQKKNKKKNRNKKGKKSKRRQHSSSKRQLEDGNSRSDLLLSSSSIKKSKKQRRRKPRRLDTSRLMVLCGGLFILLMIILVPLLCLGKLGWQKIRSSSSPVVTNTSTKEQQDDTTTDVFMPAREHSYLDVASLPASTRAMLNVQDHSTSTSSPQEQALQWVDHDPTITILQHGNNDDTTTSGTSSSFTNPSLQALDTLAAVQRFVLATLYFATNGPYWHHADDYYARDDTIDTEHFQLDYDPHNTNIENRPNHHHANFLDVSIDECDWFGIDPDGNNDDPSANAYSVCNRYQQIHTINLKNHNMTGSLPFTELSLLHNLKHVDVGHNRLTGTLPGAPIWTKWKNLETLDLSYNDMTGSFPTELGLLAQYSNGLRSMSFHHNRFTSKLPTEVGLVVTRLTTFDVTANALTGSIPTELGGTMSLNTDDGDDGFRAMEYLSLSGNDFTGYIPSELGLLLQLKSLTLTNNPFLAPQTMPLEICALMTTQNNHGQLQKLAVDCEIVHCPEGCDCLCSHHHNSTVLSTTPTVTAASSSRTSQDLIRIPSQELGTTPENISEEETHALTAKRSFSSHGSDLAKEKNIFHSEIANEEEEAKPLIAKRSFSSHGSDLFKEKNIFHL